MNKTRPIRLPSTRVTRVAGSGCSDIVREGTSVDHSLEVADQALGLHTDLYELRMAQTCLRHGMTAPATFSLHIRADERRPWFVAGGMPHVLDVLRRFSYGDAELDYLRGQGFPGWFLDWLHELHPVGEVWSVAEGTVVLAEEPLIEVTAPLPLGMLWETALLNVVQRSTVLATKAARCVIVADGRTLVDFGFRRAQGLETGIEAARAAYIGGIDATSNVEAGRRFGIPISGTMAHSLIQAYEDEPAAFAAFADDHPDQAIMLVDTYDTIGGVQAAIEIGQGLRARGSDLIGVRLDSGDLAEYATRSRALLDDAGFTATRIIASGGVDEFEIAELIAAGAPIDGFGVGTALTVSTDRPALDIAYKLVCYDGAPRAKYSEGKVLLPGAKQVYRDGAPDSDVLATRDEPPLHGEPLLAPIWRDGDALHDFDLREARDRAADQLDALPDHWRRLDRPLEPPRPRRSDVLEALARGVRDRETAHRR
ncbi:MAG TPA: nicotinate phosphoribosyltransferase [Euzebyales bacterium]|nr:nicotinate phosphoribosyltransferase [Euzebyales bacterium]